MAKLLGRSTYIFDRPPVIRSFAAAGGGKEGEGPLGERFDLLSPDNLYGADSWEQAEMKMQRLALKTALNKGGLRKGDLNILFAGDLLNQCTGSSYGLRPFMAPYLGVYGACSTMAETLLLASVFVDGRLAKAAGASTSSHFCSAERQYRYPLEYGSLRPPTAQWTATAAGAVILTAEGDYPRIEVRHACAGIIEDPGVKDANNMGAAMAPAAACLLRRYFRESATAPQDYSRIFTGDLGAVGSALLHQLLARDRLDISGMHDDCGLLLFDRARQDVHAGGSGAGCSAAVLCCHILPEMLAGRYEDVLFIATGALLSPTMVQQGESIPGIAHLVHFHLARSGKEGA